MRNLKSAHVAAVALAVLAMTGRAEAADFPTKPINFIVGFAAGGGTDAFIRALAEPMTQSLGQTVIVQNKPGAGGGVAAMTIKAAEPDGYTLIGTGSLTYTFEPQVLKSQYAYSDFTHIAITALFQDGLFTHPSRPYKTMRDVVNAAKAEKRDIKYASQYQLDKLIFEYVGKKEGVKFIPVPTGGGNGAVTATLGNQVDFGFSGGTFGPHAESGALRVIGSMMTERMERFPDVASMADNGWNIGGENFIIISASKNTPKASSISSAKLLKRA
ncbi:MAG: tripartite tricarboxylate transporter substrate binding protein [Sphingomonadales bacterium]|nr:tripartite tricarboxylate transporter substrate binding protein [Sphingomonadales bacterium]